MKLRRLWFVPVLLLGLAAGLASARAQAPPGGSPHGTLRTDCAQCHVADNWKTRPAKTDFRHEDSGFRLQGAHASVDCTSCHRALVFSNVGSACADCHRDPHQTRLGFDCQRCHSPTTWTNQRDMHAVHARSRFPLLGVHARLDCAACHRGPSGTGGGAATASAVFSGATYAGTPTDCASCHLSDYTATRNPDHQRAGFARRCDTCHLATAGSWQGVSGSGFVHSAAFPLSGAHGSLSCSSCHATGFAGTSRDCVSCHRANYDRTTNPAHARSGYPTVCDRCHDTGSWRGATVGPESHPAAFPLTGAHLRAACKTCHTSGTYVGLSRDCVSCHRPRYDATTNPNHRTAGFPTTCEGCHSTTTWTGATISADNHPAAFPLTGAHVRTSCAACHVGGRYAGTPRDCYSCHRAAYDSTTNPNHRTAAFPTSCESCHTTTSFRGATFDHRTFALTGAHVGTPCTSCHAGGRYAGTPRDCYSCHRAAYDGTTNPNHRSAGFPTSCDDCHGTSTFRGATFDHDGRYFPISSGRHGGISCSTCHTNSSNYRSFECTGCHQHSRSEMDSEHRGVSGYSYQSTACYGCHPRGAER